MQAPHPTTFRARLFRVITLIGAVAACLVALVISAVDIYSTRDFLITDLERDMTMTANVVATDAGHDELKRLKGLAKLFPSFKGLSLLCAYNKDNRLIEDWRTEVNTDQCPAFISITGVSETLTSVHIALPVSSNNVYLGILYAEASLPSVKSMLLRTGLIMLSFLSVTMLASVIASHYGARHMTGLMDAIGQQIECLKGASSECLLLPASATRETMALYNEIRSLRVHLMTTLLPREMVAHQRLWYENIFTNLFVLLRHRIPADSTILPLLADCELLLRLNAEEQLPEREVVDINRLVDEGVTSARALNPPDRQVHLVVSFKPGPKVKWKVHAAYMRSLIRHLLLIGLARTTKGLVCLRLEIVPRSQGGAPAILRWRLEDSGPPMQPGVLQSRLTSAPYKLINVTEASWLLAVQLTRRQEGAIRGENIPGGLMLSGEVPISGTDATEQGPEPEISTPAQIQEHPRLVLMAGEVSSEARRLRSAFEYSNCRVFWAENHIQALELAPALPFSTIIFNESLFSSEAHTVIRRMVAMMENKLMPTVPVWVVTASDATSEHKAWTQAGVSETLVVPVNEERIAPLCRRLVPFNARFWSACDITLLKEYSKAMEERLPELRGELRTLIRGVHASISEVPAGAYASEVMHKAHGVKSASLALGYMHLAALMANLEYMLAARQTENTKRNIAIIADCLTQISLE